MSELQEARARLAEANERRTEVLQKIERTYGSMADLHVELWSANESSKEGRKARALRKEQLSAEQECCQAENELARILREAPFTRRGRRMLRNDR